MVGVKNKRNESRPQRFESTSKLRKKSSTPDLVEGDPTHLEGVCGDFVLIRFG